MKWYTFIEYIDEQTGEILNQEEIKNYSYTVVKQKKITTFKKFHNEQKIQKVIRIIGKQKVLFE